MIVRIAAAAVVSLIAGAQSAGAAERLEGNPAFGEGDVSAYLFVDHACEPCAEADNVVRTISRLDGQVRFVRVETPIGDPKAALASISTFRSKGAEGWIADYSIAGTESDLDGAARAYGSPQTDAKSMSTARVNFAAATALQIGELPAVVVVAGPSSVRLDAGFTAADLERAIGRVRASSPRP